MEYDDDDIPTDLITKSQIGFRQLAGLNPKAAAASSSLPTIESLIPTIEENSCNLECKYCQAKLLRDLHSLICIYCGHFQNHRNPPPPIHFNSTAAYTWLLQSLSFNGSERVGSMAEVSEINGPRSPAEDELTLSQLLDLQIIWRDEPKKPNNNLRIMTSSESSTNLGSADLDFFIESKRDIVSYVSEEQNKAFEGQANRTSVTSTIDPTDDEWNAEFQFPDNTKMVNENPESVDLFVGADPDLSSRIDAVFGEIKSRNNDESDPYPSIGKDTTQDDDLFADMSSATFQQTEQLDSVQANDESSGHLSEDNLKGAEGDWFSDDNWQKSGINSTAVSNKTDQLHVPGEPNERSSGDWFENTNWQNSSANTPAVSQQADPLDKLNDSSSHDNPNDSSTDWFENTDWQKSSVTAVSQQADQLEFVGKVPQDTSNDLSTDWFQNTDWQKSTPKSTAVSHDIPNDSSLDWLENSSWQKSTSKNTAPIKDDNLFDIQLQNNQVSSPSLDLDKLNKQHSDAATTDWFQDSDWPMGASSSTSNMVANKDDDDGFDEWNDFTSSTANLNSKQTSNDKVGHTDNMPELPSSTADRQVNIDDLVANKDGDDGFDEWNNFTSSQKYISNEKVGPTEKMSELNEDFGDFFQSDLFSGSSSNKNQNDTQAVYDIFSEASTTSRTANTEDKNSVEESKNDEITPSATKVPKTDVQMLLSEMHDLSFMLKSELSIPFKPDGPDPSHSK